MSTKTEYFALSMWRRSARRNEQTYPVSRASDVVVSHRARGGEVLSHWYTRMVQTHQSFTAFCAIFDHTQSQNGTCHPVDDSAMIKEKFTSEAKFLSES